MVDQQYHSQLSQENVRYCPASSGNLVVIERLGFSTDTQRLLVPDACNSGNSPNGPQFLSTTQKFGFCSPTVHHVSLQFTSGLRRSSNILTPTQADTQVNMHSPILGRSPNQQLTLPSSEVCHRTLIPSNILIIIWIS